MKKVVNLSLLFLIFPGWLLAQRSFDMGLVTGLSSYLGEFAPTVPSLRQSHVAVGISGRYFLNPRWAVKGQFIYSSLSGDDADTRNANRGWQFHTPLMEGLAQIEIHPFAHARRNYGILDRKQLTSYFFTGIGAVYVQPQLIKSRESTATSETMPGKVMITLPIGAGLRYEFGKRLLLSGEMGIRTPLSDQLDGASLRPHLANHDWYLLGGITISYLIFAED
jgi:hypothetical protein